MPRVCVGTFTRSKTFNSHHDTSTQGWASTDISYRDNTPALFHSIGTRNNCQTQPPLRTKINSCPAVPTVSQKLVVSQMIASTDVDPRVLGIAGLENYSWKRWHEEYFVLGFPLIASATSHFTQISWFFRNVSMRRSHGWCPQMLLLHIHHAQLVFYQPHLRRRCFPAPAPLIAGDESQANHSQFAQVYCPSRTETIKTHI